MHGTNDILQELRSLSELVASISRQTPYRVADDYFPDLPIRTMSLIKTGIKTHHKSMAFNVPDGYFEGFAKGMLARIKADTQPASAVQTTADGAGRTSGISQAAAAGRTTLPETAAGELAALSPLLAQLRPLGTYQMPEGYFGEMAPILAVAKELNPYTVPEEYFQQLPGEVEEKLLQPRVEKTPVKVIPMGGRRTNWWKYSAAAVVAGLIFTIGWLRLQPTGGDHHGTTVASTDVPANLMKVSDQDLQSFLSDQDESLAQQPANATATIDFNDNDVRSLLGDLPDGDLKQYMDDHGGTVDIATN
jgi:hypothetical protein